MRNREEKNICCICGDQKDDFDLITFDQGKKICTTCGRKLNMIFDGEKWDNTGEIKKSDEEKSFFSNDFIGSGENRKRRLYPKEKENSGTTSNFIHKIKCGCLAGSCIYSSFI